MRFSEALLVFALALGQRRVSAKGGKNKDTNEKANENETTVAKFGKRKSTRGQPCRQKDLLCHSVHELLKHTVGVVLGD